MGKWDLVKAVTQKLMRISKNRHFFGLDGATTIILLKKIMPLAAPVSVRITEKYIHC